MVDREIDMLPAHMTKNTAKRYFSRMSVSDMLQTMINTNGFASGNPFSEFDIAFCRQAVNYWMNPQNAKNLAKIMSADGVFIFNTFNTKPPTDPKVKEYHLYNIKFVEISYIDKNDNVHHVQVREGMEPHITQFKWMSEEYLKNCLDKWFDIDIIVKNKTDVYKCTKKDI